jgi:hypothetical protein
MASPPDSVRKGSLEKNSISITTSTIQDVTIMLTLLFLFFFLNYFGDAS